MFLFPIYKSLASRYIHLKASTIISHEMFILGVVFPIKFNRPQQNKFVYRMKILLGKW